MSSLDSEAPSACVTTSDGADTCSDAVDRDELYADFPMPAAWRPVLEDLLPVQTTAPLATSLPQLEEWTTQIKSRLKPSDLDVLWQVYAAGVRPADFARARGCTRQNVDQAMSGALRRMVQLAPEAMMAIRAILEPLSHSVGLVFRIEAGRELDFAFAVGMGARLLDIRADIKSTGGVHVVANHCRLEGFEREVRKACASLDYSTPAEVAAGLGVDAIELQTLALLRPGLLALGRGGRVVFHVWNKAHHICAVAKALSQAGFIEWHSSQLLKAAALTNPDDFAGMTPREALALIHRAPGKVFEKQVSRATYRVAGFGDGHRTTLDAIRAAFDAHGGVLHHADLQALMHRSATPGSIVAALSTHPTLFLWVAPGVFACAGSPQLTLPEEAWLLEQIPLGAQAAVEVLQKAAVVAGLNPCRLRGIAASRPGLALGHVNRTIRRVAAGVSSPG